ncbi:MAG TPA: hypothetical protein DEQ61_11400, partial [Streptomyces sp.]|nr:hypothetical protein [Streptomyces sp.]
MVNDRPPSGSPYPTAPTPDASYGHYAAYGQDSRIGYAGYDAYGTGTFEHVATGYGEGDPLFGSMPGAPDTSGQWDTGTQPVAGYDAYGSHQDHQESYEQQQPYQQPYDPQQQLYDTGSYDTGGYDATHYGTGSYDTTAMWGDASASYQPGHAQADSTGQWGTGSWNVADQYDPAQYDATQFEQPQYEQPGFEQPGFDQTAQYEQPQFEQPHPDQAQFDQSQYGPGDGSQGVGQDSSQYSAQYQQQQQQQQYDPAGYGGPYETTTHYGSGPGFDTSGQWEASQWQQPQDGAQWWDAGGFARPDEQPAPGEEHSRTAHEAEPERTAVFESVHEAATEPESGSERVRSHESGMEPPETASGSRSGSHPGSRSRSAATAPPVSSSAHAPVQRRAGSGGRSRRRSPAKRSALLTVAVPSVA